MIPGAKGLQSLLHCIPTWISFRETERMEWLNRILHKVRRPSQGAARGWLAGWLAGWRWLAGEVP